MVEVWDGEVLTKSLEADFKLRHAGILSDFFKDFVTDRNEELEEARRVMGSAGDGKMTKLERYLETHEFTNPHADMNLSNTFKIHPLPPASKKPRPTIKGLMLK